MRALTLLVAALMLAGCTSLPGDGSQSESDAVTVLNLCLLSLCESADRLERIGDRDNEDSYISEEINEGMESEQSEKGSLDVDATPL